MSEDPLIADLIPDGGVVLLVDDETNILSALKRVLRRDGYTLLTAGSGEAGLEILRDRPVDVILSDQRMPGMSGVEFLRHAKSLRPDTVRMVLSGYTELQSITNAINEGAIFKFLTKPWDDEQLRAIVAEAVRYRGLAVENQRLTLQLREANQRLEANLAERQQALERNQRTTETLHEVLQLMPWPLLVVDEFGMVVAANLGASKLFPTPGGLLGQNIDCTLPAAVMDNPSSSMLQIGDECFYLLNRNLGLGETGRGRLLLFKPSECTSRRCR